jgi:hypothetical protein
LFKTAPVSGVPVRNVAARVEQKNAFGLPSQTANPVLRGGDSTKLLGASELQGVEFELAEWRQAQSSSPSLNLLEKIPPRHKFR